MGLGGKQLGREGRNKLRGRWARRIRIEGRRGLIGGIFWWGLNLQWLSLVVKTARKVRRVRGVGLLVVVKLWQGLLGGRKLNSIAGRKVVSKRAIEHTHGIVLIDEAMEFFLFCSMSSGQGPVK